MQLFARFALSFFLLCPALGTLHAALDLTVDAGGAVLINGDTGRVLFQKNASQPFFPASITKIATALYVLKQAPMRLEEKVIAKAEALGSITPGAKRDSRYRAPPYLLETDGAHMGIKRGEEFLLRDLVYAMLVRSPNDAANVIAQNVGGTIPAFVEGMNRYLKELGCSQTHFCNPHGLHHPDHVTTPMEMAMIAQEAMRYPLFRKMVSTVHFTVPETNLEEERKLLQTNLLLRSGPSFFPKAIGIKTGTNSNAGKTLVAAAEDKGRMLIAVVMGYTGKGDRYSDAIHMFEAAFAEKKYRNTLLPKGLQKFSFNLPHAKEPLKIVLHGPVNYDYYPSEKEEVHLNFRWEKIQLPLAKGQEVGQILVVNSKGHIFSEARCFAAAEVKPSFSYSLKRFFTHKGKSTAFVIGAVALLLGFMRLRRRSQRA